MSEPEVSWEDVGLVIPVPAPDTVLLVMREGDKYAYMPVAREFLEDTEQCWPTLSKVLTHMDRYIEQMEQHGKARNANGEPATGT
jgi:hypothetical protein